MRFSGANELLGQASGRFDGHAHVFRSDLPMIADRRYTPSYDAELRAFVELLRNNGLDGALLIQPSFLGTDNSYLLSQLLAATAIPNMTVRGVATLDPDTSKEEISELSNAGIVGLRLNLIGGSARVFDIEPLDKLLRRIDAFGWHVELHCEGALLAPILGSLLKRCRAIVVDHLGLPDGNAPLECTGLSAILAAPLGRVYVKASAPYRVFSQVAGDEAALRCAPVVDRLVNGIGNRHLVWGSDWPWTRFENLHSYTDTLAWFQCAEDRKASASA